jgi:hypothetical protein
MLIERFIQVVGGVFLLFIIAGGGFAHHEAVGDNTIRTTILTLYKSLPPAPAGPSYCDVVRSGDRSLVLPCDFKPPFIGWLEGGKY